MNAFNLHYWVAIRGVPDAQAIPAAFAKKSDAETWATVQSTVYGDTRDVWHCVSGTPAVKLSAYCAGKVVA